MNLEDESYLSAYLDGELDPAGRLRVESALASDPTLGEQLRELAAVRDLVASLPRPSPLGDPSEAILARIRGRARTAGRLRTAGRGLAELAVAAAILATMTAGMLQLIGLLPRRPGRAPVVARAPVPPRPQLPASRPVETTPARPRETPVRPPVVAAVPGTRPVVADVAEERRGDLEQRRIRDLLDSPDLRRVLVVTDVIGGDAPKQVGDLLRGTPRVDPFCARMTVSQGIIVDPRHPGQATVFALIMDDREFQQLRSKLGGSFPDSVEESDPDPAAVTMLADIGQVEVFSGPRASDLVAPPESPPRLTAIKADVKPPKPKLEVATAESEFPGQSIGVVEPLPPLSVNPAEAPSTPERERSAPAPTPRGPAGPAPLARGEEPAPPSMPLAFLESRTRQRLRDRQASIVLVWVASR